MRWLEWGVQSYVRVLFGLTMLLVGAAILATRTAYRWTGWVSVLAGVLSIAVGVDVAYSGLASRFQQVATPAFQLVVFAFAIGVLLAARVREQDAATP